MKSRSVQKPNLQTLVTKEILRRIAEQRYPVGSQLPPERVMAQDLRVSRPTLRQALALLQSLGVLTVKHGSGNLVNDPQSANIPPALGADIVALDVEFLQEIIEARRAIEGVATKLAATNRSKRDLQKLQALQESMISGVGHTARFVEADMKFHQAMCNSSGNRFLAELLEEILPKQHYFMIATTSALHSHRQTVEHNQHRLDAVASGDSAAAFRALSGYFRVVERRIAQVKSTGTVVD